MKPQHLQYLPLVAGLLRIVQGFVGVIVPPTRRVGGVGLWVEICAIPGGIGEDGLTFVVSVQQCRFGGRAVGMDDAWLARSAAGAYPHRMWLDTCATKKWCRCEDGAGPQRLEEHGLARSKPVSNYQVVVYYESMNRNLKIKPIYECRCNERLQTKRFVVFPRTHWVGRVTGTPKDKDEVNKREVCECEG